MENIIQQFSAETQESLKDLGFANLTKIQERTIPYILQGEDVIAQSRTGTGKTAAFGIPLFEHVDPSKRSVQAIVLAPTRELAMQVAKDFKGLGKHSKIKVLVVYGGVGLGSQIRQLENGDAHIVVGTPGRVLDLIGRGALDLSEIRFFILDEADIMLDMGFSRDVERILESTAKKKQVLLFCVDFPQELLQLAKRHMRYPQHVKLISSEISARGVTQYFYPVRTAEKLGILIFLINKVKPSKAIIFCRTKRKVERLAHQLAFNGIPAKGLQGDMSQAQRTRAMEDFKDGKTQILVATDVAARGIHVEKISHIFNYELPHDIKYYVHRIGRTARVLEIGTAITLCDADEARALYEIEQIIGERIEERELPANIPAPKIAPRAPRSPRSYGRRSYGGGGARGGPRSEKRGRQRGRGMQRGTRR